MTSTVLCVIRVDVATYEVKATKPVKAYCKNEGIVRFVWKKEGELNLKRVRERLAHDECRRVETGSVDRMNTRFKQSGWRRKKERKGKEKKRKNEMSPANCGRQAEGRVLVSIDAVTADSVHSDGGNLDGRLYLLNPPGKPSLVSGTS